MWIRTRCVGGEASVSDAAAWCVRRARCSARDDLARTRFSRGVAEGTPSGPRGVSARRARLEWSARSPPPPLGNARRFRRRDRGFVNPGVFTFQHEKIRLEEPPLRLVKTKRARSEARKRRLAAVCKLSLLKCSPSGRHVARSRARHGVVLSKNVCKQHNMPRRLSLRSRQRRVGSKKTTDVPKRLGRSLCRTSSSSFFFHQLYLASMSFCSYLSAASSQLRSWLIPLAMIRLNAAGWSLNVPMA
jgi:hypothetical protein